MPVKIYKSTFSVSLKTYKTTFLCLLTTLPMPLISIVSHASYNSSLTYNILFFAIHEKEMESYIYLWNILSMYMNLPETPKQKIPQTSN